MGLKLFNSIHGFSVGLDHDNVIDSDGNIVANNLTVTGNATAHGFTANSGVFTGNGSGLTTLVGANITGQVGNALVAGTVYSSSQPNITSVGTISNLTTSGNIVGVDNSSLALNSYVGAAEGAQITLAWKGVTGLTGQGNSSWNIDVDGSNTFRVFYQTSTGDTGIAMQINSSTATVELNKILTLQTSSSAPSTPTTGMFAVADRTNWDPASKGSGNPYPVFYNGSTWNALY